MNNNCARAEILAGAIALGEASDHERDDYRRHISACASCLRELGGEREIERVMETISVARESEVWDPAPMRAGERRARKIRFALGTGAATVAAAVAISLGIQALVAANARPLNVAMTSDAAPQSAFHVSLERRTQPPAAKTKPAPSIVVVHNVTTLVQTQKSEPKAPVHVTQIAVGPTSRPAPAKVPVWRRDQAPSKPQEEAPVTIARSSETAPVLGGHAESIAVAPSYIVRDVVPIGGDTAINPRPAPIAYAMGAEGTTAFEVTVDEHGAPIKCTITKPSGYLVLDTAVCKAAMAARYSPRTVNGRPTVGLYRDAFTFRAQNNTDNQL